MHTWFQNLNDDKKHLFHFRGSFGPSWEKTWCKYEILTNKLDVKFSFTLKPYKSISLTIGLAFLTMYLTLPFFRFKKLDGPRETGFYFHNWAFVWFFMRKEWESSSNLPWWKYLYFHIDDFFLGKVRTVERELFVDGKDVQFKIGDKDFKLDKVKWKNIKRFRGKIPFDLWHHEFYVVDMKCSNPPMHSGKGTTSYNCGDDGTYGLYGPWKHEPPTYNNREESLKKAVEMYVESAMDSVKRYGSTNAERGVKAEDKLEFIGMVKSKPAYQDGDSTQVGTGVQ